MNREVTAPLCAANERQRDVQASRPSVPVLFALKLSLLLSPRYFRVTIPHADSSDCRDFYR